MTNIAELLKDAPKGMKLYSPLLGEVEFAEVMDTDYVPIRVMCGVIGERFDEFGRYKGNEYPNAECLLFPSKDCRTWEGWKLPVEPKFKVGDKIEATIYGIKRRVTIREVDKTNRCYFGTLEECIGFSEQDQWHLAPKKHYDIANFKPGMPVLVRDNIRNKWLYTLFGMYNEDNVAYPFVVVDMRGYARCIPFNEETKHMLGTTDMPSEKYINW